MHSNVEDILPLTPMQEGLLFQTEYDRSGPDGQLLPPGAYVLRVIAYPVEQGLPSLRRLPFVLR